MPLQDDLFSLEEKLWTQGGDYCARHVAPAAMMVLPEPAGVLVKDEIASSLQGGRWSGSAYVRDGAAWKLAFRQETPIAPPGGA